MLKVREECPSAASKTPSNKTKLKLQIIAPVEGKSWHIGHTILVGDEARFLVTIPKGEKGD